MQDARGSRFTRFSFDSILSTVLRLNCVDKLDIGGERVGEVKHFFKEKLCFL